MNDDKFHTLSPILKLSPSPGQSYKMAPKVDLLGRLFFSFSDHFYFGVEDKGELFLLNHFEIFRLKWHSCQSILNAVLRATWMQTDDGEERRGEEEVFLNWLEIAQNGSCSNEWSSFSPLFFVLKERYLTSRWRLLCVFFMWLPILPTYILSFSGTSLLWSWLLCLCRTGAARKRADSQHGI